MHREALSSERPRNNCSIAIKLEFYGTDTDTDTDTDIRDSPIV